VVVPRACRAGRPRSPQGGPAHCGATATSLAQRCAGGTCGPPWATRGPASHRCSCQGLLGQVISPLLANVYLHYVLDLWAKEWRKRHARGEVIVVRYADDTVIGFEHRTDAVRFLADLERRMAEYALALHPDKTRLIEFGRFAAANRKARGLGKPETFDFLGFTHICGRTRKGRFQVRRRSRRDRMRAKL
jgi:hypothetical protein